MDAQTISQRCITFLIIFFLVIAAVVITPENNAVATPAVTMS